MSFRVAIVLVCALAIGLPYRAIASESTSTVPTITTQKDGPMIAAERKKKKKKRKKNADDTSADEQPSANGEETSGSTDSSSSSSKSDEKPAALGKTIHKAQEGHDTPYSWEVGLRSDLQRVTTETKAEGEGAEAVKGGFGEYDLALRGLYVIGHSFEVGAELSYYEKSTKVDESKTKETRLKLIPEVLYNFGNVDKDVNVFFVYGGLGISQDSVKSDTSETNASLTGIVAGLGLHHFVDSNVAISAEVQFDLDSGSSKSGEAKATVSQTSIHLLKLGFTLFI